MKESFFVNSAYNKIKCVISYPTFSDSSYACVILSHGLLSSKDSSKYIEMAELLTQRGIMSIRFDYHGCGESEGKIEETNLTIRLENLEKIFEFALKHPKVNRDKIAIFGSSFGGVTAILLASKKKIIKSLVILSTPYELERNGSKIGVNLPQSFFDDFFSYNVLEAARSVSSCLVVHGQKDEIVPSFHAEKIYENLLDPKKLVIVENADHTFSDPSQRKMVLKLALDWFESYLL